MDVAREALTSAASGVWAALRQTPMAEFAVQGARLLFFMGQRAGLVAVVAVDIALVIALWEPFSGAIPVSDRPLTDVIAQLGDGFFVLRCPALR